ncbi:hypothetical protein DTO164E3_3255 [Paecilomyces variotii]|nr:hypothetical protein DTO032I3_8986 [Paecilomyces variotii]KAJ9201817.1 hypothetical protein DTO164E3_3255 [Paecilomyces variotii]KAJ9274658.1 hypothetical protein DTO021D3_8463 [Paecilomyces variotii]KAJ9338376.1 hypothetical protein DTO027B6_9087 [Paecilomyces variotii]KAJ9378282.1 hypothetical protein DTO063F5_7781 [Paecilomyces variotii]
MAAPHYRKIELQSPADLSYLYTNTLALSRRKLDLHLPPSASGNDPDPMRERVRELVDEFINRTFTTASSSIEINGLDSSSAQFPFPTSFAAPETVEYEPYDGKLASRLTSLYAQLESLTTTVAQLRRDAPGRAAKNYAQELKNALREDDEEFEKEELADEREQDDADLQMTDAPKTEDESSNNDNDNTQNQNQGISSTTQRPLRRSPRIKKEWKLSVPLGTAEEEARWRNGEMAEVYSDALRTLLRLQGEAVVGDEHDESDSTSSSSRGIKALATTLGKAERAGRAADVVEHM